ncbi:MAG: arginine--tRNA ligase [Candidatus Anstonellales archaeon]
MLKEFEVSKLRGYDLSMNQRRISDLKILDEIKSNSMVDRIDIINNYVNIRLKPEYYQSISLESSRLNRVVSIEYPSVNPNKPWHIGHLRNAIIGESMYQILKEKYSRVYTIDYIDDLGLQVAQSYWYYRKYGITSDHQKFDHAIGMDYVRANELLEHNEKEIREVLREMEEKNIAREFVDKVLEYQLQTARLYGIHADYRIYESDIKRDLFDKGIEHLKKLGYIIYATEGELKGTYITKFNHKVIIRSDGTATYLGKDIIFQLWKAGLLKGIRFINRDGVLYSSNQGSLMDLNSDIIINVIGIEQSSHQQEIKELFNNIAQDKEYYHLSYQRVKLKEGHFSGRKGNWLGYTADDLYREAIERIGNRDLALASIKFFILKHNPKTEVIFDWEKALSTQGGSGVYVLYTYVRMLGLEKNSTVTPELKEVDEDDRELLKFYLYYNTNIDKSIKYLDPSIIAEYILKIAEEFNSYYSKHRIANNPSKLWVIKKIKYLYEKLLDLLTIPRVSSI